MPSLVPAKVIWQNAQRSWQGESTSFPWTSDKSFAGHTSNAARGLYCIQYRFTGDHALPQGADLDSVRINGFRANNAFTATNYNYCYLGVVNNLKTGEGELFQIEDEHDYDLSRWVQGRDQSGNCGASVGLTHNHANGLDEPGPVEDGFGPQQSEVYLYRAFDGAMPTSSSITPTRDFTGALQALVNHPDWNETDQTVSVVLFYEAAQRWANGSGWTFRHDNLHDGITWASGDSGAHPSLADQAYISSPAMAIDGGQFRAYYTHDLEYEWNPDTLTFTGSATSSGNVKTKTSRAWARWYGADANDGENLYSFYPTISFGRGDLPPHYSWGQNPLSVTWVSPAERMQIEGNSSSTNTDRKQFYFRQEAVGSTTGIRHDTYFWNDGFPRKTSIDTWSARWYYWSPYTYAYDSKFWAAFNDGVEVQSLLWLKSDNAGADNDLLWGWTYPSAGNSGWSGINGAAYTRRVEMQMSNHADTPATMRVFSGESTTPQFVWEKSFDVTIDRIQFAGGNAGFTGQHTGTGMRLRDYEFWDDYDLGGQFTQDASSGVGFPYVEPNYEWFFYDGTTTVELEEIGVVRTISSDGSSPTLTHEGTPESELTWISDLTGTDGASVDVELAASVAFGGSNIGTNSCVVYDDSLAPPGLSKSLKHYVSSDANDVASLQTTAFNETSISNARTFIRMYFYIDQDLDVANNTGYTPILAARDFSGDTRWMIKLNYLNRLYVLDGEAYDATTIQDPLDVGKWYRLEVFHDDNVNPAEQRNPLQIRLFDDVGLVATKRMFLDWNPGTYVSIEWGPHVGYFEQAQTNPTDTWTGTIHTAGHAVDSTDWIGGTPEDGGYEPVFEYGSMEGTSNAYRVNSTPRILSSGYESSEIRYGIGTGDTSLRRMKFWAPEGDPPEEGWPCTVFVHGGSWVGGHYNDVWDGPLARFLLSQGIAIFSVGYQLSDAEALFNAPGAINPPAYSLGDSTAGRFPTHILDIKQALHWIKNNASANPYNVDMERIFGTAYSAGTFNLLGAVATKDITNDGASTTYDWSLAGNSGPPYYYDDEGQGDPDVLKCLYLMGPVANPKKVADFESNEGPGIQIFSSGTSYFGGYLMNQTIRNAYADHSAWYENITYNNIGNWASIAPDNQIPLGANMGDLDWLVVSDPHEMHPDYSQYKELKDAYNNGSVTAETDLFIADMHHYWVNHEINFEHILAFIRKYI